MAKQKKSRIDNGDFRFDSELDFNFDGGFDTFDTKKASKKRKPVHDVIRGTADATKSKLKSGSFWNDFAKKALPKSYSIITDELKKSSEILSETYRESARLLKPDLARIGRQVDSLVPEESRRIKKWTNKLKSHQEQNISASAEAFQNQAITQAQTEIFGRMQDHTDAKEARDRAEQRVKDKLDAKRFSANANILGNINEGIQRLASYTMSVNSSYQKKSLELQYRSYFVQAELLKTTTKYNELFKAYFEAIKDNTALPDFVKITKSERFREIARTNIYSGIQQGISGGFKRATKRLGGYVRGAAGRLGDITMGLDSVDMLRDQMKTAKEMGIDESMLYHSSNGIGGALIDFIASKAGKKLGRFFPQGGFVSRNLARGARFVKNPTQGIDKLQKSKGYQKFINQKGPMGDFARFMNMFVNDFKTPKENANLTKGGDSAGHMTPHFFSQKAHKSLTEVIPGYLARILQETSAIRMGSRNLGQLPTYDWRRGRFTTSSKLQSKIRTGLLGVSSTGAMDYKLDQVSKAFTGNELTGDQSVRVKQFIHTISGNPEMDYNSNKVFRSKAFLTLPREDRRMIITQMKKHRGSQEAKSVITNVMRDVGETHSNQIAAAKNMMQQLIQEGHQEELIRAKLIRPNKQGGYDINLQKYNQLIQSRGITAKGIAPKKASGWIIPTNEKGEHENIGDIEGKIYDTSKKRYMHDPNYTPDPDKKPFMTFSDRNAKTNIGKNRRRGVLSRLARLATYKYRYRGGNDKNQHQGFMAQEVNKTFGDNAAPGGTAVDMSYMTSMNTEGIQELHRDQQKQMKDPTSIDLLRDISKRLGELGAISKVGMGIEPTGDSKSLFGDTANLASRYIRILASRGAAGTGRAGRLLFGTAGAIGRLVRRHGGGLLSNVGDLAGEYGPSVAHQGISGLGRGGRFLLGATGGLFGAAGGVGRLTRRALGRYARPAISSTAGFIGNHLFDGLGRMGDFLTGSAKLGGRALGGLGGGLRSILGGFGSGKTNKTLEKILGILKKWDKRGMGGGMSGASPTTAAAAAMDSDDTSSVGGSGQGFAAMGAVSSGLRGLRNIIGGPKAQALFGRFKGLKGIKRLGGLGGGRLGRWGGGLMSGLGSLFGAGASDESHDPSDPQQAATKSPGLFSRLMNSVKRVSTGPAAELNPEGEKGRRGGDWRTRLENMKGGLNNQGPAIIAGPRYQENTGGGIFGLLKGFTSFLTGNLGSIFSFARGTLGKLGGVGGRLAGMLGKTRLGAAAGNLLGKVGAPVRSVLGRVGARLGLSAAADAVGATAAEGAVAAGAEAVVGAGVAEAGIGIVGAGLTALGAIFASPFVLGALAVGVVAYGGYKLFKYLTRDNLDEFQKFRFMQYGFGTSSTESYNHKLANLENYLLDGKVAYQPAPGSTDKKAYILGKSVVAEELYKVFDVDPTNRDQVYPFQIWLKGRFLPFFLNTMTALYNTNQKVKLDKLDKLTPDEKLKFLKAAQFDGGPYNLLDSPVPTEVISLSSNKEAVNKQVEFLIGSASYDKKKQHAQATNLTKQDKAILANKMAAETAAQTKKVTQDTLNAAKDKVYQTRLDTVTQNGNQVSNNGKLPSVVNTEAEGSVLGKGSGGTALDPSAVGGTKGGTSNLTLAAGAILDGNGAMKYIKLKDQSVTFDGVNPSVLKNFMGMVQEYGDATGNSVQVNSAYRSLQEQIAEYQKNPGKAARPGGSMHGFGLALDVNSKDVDALEKMGLMRKYGFTRPVGGETWHIEPAGVQENIALAKSNPNMATQMTDASLLKGGGGLGSIAGSPMGKRDRDLQVAILNADSQPANNTTAGSAAGKLSNLTTPATVPTAANDKTYNASSAVAKLGNQNLAPMTNTTGNKSLNVVKNNQYTMDVSPKTSFDTEKGSPSTQAGGMGSDNADGSNFTMDRDGILKAIDVNAKKAGVDGKHMQVIAAVESGLDPQARASSTGASGLFQFEASTWNESMRKYGSKYGLSGNESPSNIGASTVLAGEYMKSNLQAVKQANPQAGVVDAYLAHFLGASGARTFLHSNPQAIGAQVFPGPAKRNPGIFFEGGRALTIAEIYTKIGNRLDTAAKSFGISGVTISKSFPNLPSGRTGMIPAVAMNQSVVGTSAAVFRAPASPATGDYQSSQGMTPVYQPPKQIAASSPVYTSNRRDSDRIESGPTPLDNMVIIAGSTLNIQQKSLDTMIEIRDLIKTFVSMKSGSSTSPVIAAQQPSNADVIQPMINTSRTRNVT